MDKADPGADAAARQRLQVAVAGIVQGVGFRPFVYRLASELGLSGWVRNDSAGVTLEVEGLPSQLRDFLERLRTDAPPLSRIDEVQSLPRPLGQARDGFSILESRSGRAATAIGPDTALCGDCLREMLDPADRRWRHAFINCTNCGPRFTLTRALPYDRAMTSMARFTQCPACEAEYRSPLNRRFHAEPNACPVCGPQLSLCAMDGTPRAHDDPLAGALACIAQGGIVAVKGLGGFHLVCDARQASAVAALRQRKSREEKPFAVMVAGLASLRGLADPGEADRALLCSAERPVVLLRKAPGVDAQLPGVAPGLAWLGAMLPCTPLQVLLFHEAAGRPAGTGWMEQGLPLALVMTSANPGGEPLVTDNDEALARLAGIADLCLMHDREILQRCDDSVLRVSAGGAPQFVRRARGFTPRAIQLPLAGPPGVAVGGHFKNTACVVRGREAFLTAHVGDLDNAPTCRALDDAVEHLLRILELRPAWVAHDLHQDFYSTRLAARLAQAHGARLVPVQHHHAHVAAVMAEHGLDGPVLGLALDGVGLGSDGSAWGGELLHVRGDDCRRVGHLQPLRLPGGDRAAREPWRLAVSVLVQAVLADRARARFGDEPGLPAMVSLLQRGLHAPWTSSLGRWFDAASALLGLRRRMAFEGQAAMELEGLADAHGEVPPEPDLLHIGLQGVLDPTALLLQLAAQDDAARGAARFHATLAWGLAELAARAARPLALDAVACSGGCFLNAVLSRALRRELRSRGLQMLEAREVPPNDGGLSLGQAWVACHRPAP